MINSGGAIQTSDSPWRFLDALGFDSNADQQLVRLTRDDELGELHIVTNLVRSSKASILYAYSGNGKSSLINAGLIPNMLGAKYVVFRTRPRPPFATDSPAEAFKACMLREVWVPEVDPAARPLADELLKEMAGFPGPRSPRLTAILERISSQWARLNTPGSLRASYIEHMQSKMHLPLREFVAATQTFFGSSQYLLFVCDQFEELFVHYLNQPVLHDFVTEIGQIVADPKLHAQFLFSMREDWVGSMLQLREQIPEILLNMYQLLPLRRSAAAPVLEFPLKSLGLKFEQHLIDKILTDLTDFYSVLQRRQQYTAISLTRSPEEDPYLELPALQVVAEKLWETRGRASVPFSFDHYLKLPALLSASAPSNNGAAPDSRSPVHQVLDSYLPEMLARIGEPELKATPAIDRRELRIDILHALTDGAAHRKALPGPMLLAECNRAQPTTAVELEQALAPLIAARLIRTAIGRGDEKEYELAHDFLVRSVVALWEGLDRQRAARLALAQQTKKDLEKFQDSQRRVHLSMIWLPLLALLAIALSGIAADRERRQAISALQDLEGSLQVSLEQLDRVDHLPREARPVLQLMRRRLSAEDLVKYTEWPTFLQFLGQQDIAPWFPIGFSRFQNDVQSLQKRDYSWTLIAPTLAGLLLWFLAGIAANRPGQVAGILTVAGCVALGAVSATAGLNWDGQWGWRTVIAFVLIPWWIAAGARASIRLWPMGSAPYRWRALSAHSLEYLLMYAIAIAPDLARRSLSEGASAIWVSKLPAYPVFLLLGVGLWLAVQTSLVSLTGSTLGCLLTGLRLVSPVEPAAKLSVVRAAVRELVRWVEFLLVFGGVQALAAKTSANSDLSPFSDIVFLTFAAPLIIYCAVNLPLKRTLEDRIAGLDFTPESVAQPDFTSLAKLLSIFGLVTFNPSVPTTPSLKPPV